MCTVVEHLHHNKVGRLLYVFFSVAIGHPCSISISCACYKNFIPRPKSLGWPWSSS